MKAVFIDTMGFFSLLNRRDAWHSRAREVMEALGQRKTPLLTTDYVIDETATLLKVRGANHAIGGFFDLLERSDALTLTFIGSARFTTAKDLFLRRRDHGYSFTDVTSFVVMEELGMRRAFTQDGHFVEAGFTRLLE